MHRLLPVALALVTACATAAPPGTITPPPPVVTVPPTSTTSDVVQPMEVQDCSTPPVTFSALCQVYQLIQDWYMDSPVDDQRLLGEALAGLDGFTTDAVEEPPRTLFCAIPDRDFAELCDRLAERVGRESLPVGEAIDSAVAAMVGFGLDPFSTYLPPKQVVSIRTDGVVEGVGIVLDARDAAGSRCLRVAPECPLEIAATLEGNAGVEAGLVQGDQIVAVDGVAVDGMDFVAVAAAIGGDATGVVELTVIRGSETLAFTIRRAPLTLPTVEFGLTQPGVGYLRIPDFEDDIPGLVEEALRSLLEEGASTIVIDLRDNPGGFIDAAVEVASMFIPGGTVVVTTSADGFVERPVSREALAPGLRLVVMVNRGTASAAEILAGALRDRRDAILVGTPTFGKEAIQIAFDLRNGGELDLTIAHWTTPEGSSPGNGGLLPDRELEWEAGTSVEQAVAAALKASS